MITVLVKPFPVWVIRLIELAAMDAAAVWLALDDEPEAVVSDARDEVPTTFEDVDEVEADVVMGELEIALDESTTALDVDCDPPELPALGQSAFTPWP